MSRNKFLAAIALVLLFCVVSIGAELVEKGRITAINGGSITIQTFHPGMKGKGKPSGQIPGPEVTVYFSGSTKVKDIGGAGITSSALKVGDFVNIRGTASGQDIKATAIRKTKGWRVGN